MEKSSDLQSIKSLEDKIQQLERRVEREKNARKQAESLLESKSIELYESNNSLQDAKVKLESQLSKNKEFLTSINDFTSYLVGKDNLRDIGDTIIDRLLSKYDLEDCIIYSIEGDVLYPISAYGSKSELLTAAPESLILKYKENFIGKIVESGKPGIFNELDIFQAINNAKVPNKSILAVPIKFEGDVIGIIYSEHNERDFFNENHLKTVTTISSLVGVIFKNSKVSQSNVNLQTNIEKRTETLNSLVENLHSGLLLNDENGKIVLFNKVFEKILKFNMPHEEIVGMDQRKSADLTKHLFSNPREFIDTIEYCIENNKVVSNKELEMKDGRILDCDFIPIYSKNEFIGQLWQVRDVTESRLADKALQASEEKYRGIIENMELGLLEVDVNHIILKAYDWFCKMTGYTEEELIGRDARKVFLTDEYLQMMDEQDRLREKGEQSVYEVQMRKKNGEFFWVLISGAPFYDTEGNYVGSVGIHYNIDERKKLEEELKFSKLQTEQAREAEKQFLANMSHEIRNPLNAIIGITNLLYDTRLNKNQLEHLNKIKYSSDILMGLISEILDISKIQSGTLKLNEKPVDISEIVSGLIKIAGFNIKDKHLKYVNKIPANGDYNVMADPTVINQIFLNLINNATKFTEEGSITITGKILETTEAFKIFEFRVQDTGIGIEADKLNKIFDIFEQADSEVKLKYGGTGLGLNIVKKLIGNYHGTVRAESVKNEGTTIIFTIKARNVEPVIPEMESLNYESKNEARVLVVEDNEINQYYLSGILSKWKIEHDIANHGIEAIELLEKSLYDLILMDIRMPQMDGYETTIKLRSMKNNKNAEIPIIALTASALVDEREKALNAGMNFHLTKPFTEKGLGLALSEFGIIQIVETENSGLFKFSDELDTKYLNNYYEDDIQRAQIMFDIFLKVIFDEFDKVKVELKSKNWDAVASQIHKIKPNFAFVGLTEISKQMEYYEMVKNNSEIRNQLLNNFSKLEGELKQGSIIVKKELKKMNEYLNQ